MQIVIFRFGGDYDLALAWMYARHRGPTLVSSVSLVHALHGLLSCDQFKTVDKSLSILDPFESLEICLLHQ